MSDTFEAIVYPQVLHLQMHQSNYSALFNDSRLERRGEQLLNCLFRGGNTSSIQSISSNRAEQKAYYRFLRNEKIEEELLIEEMTSRCTKNAAGKVVLAIQDGSEINVSSHRNRIRYDESLGPINDSKGIGFKLHPSFVMNAHTYYPYGYSAIHLWTRPHQKKVLSEYEHRSSPVSGKSTNIWLESNRKTYETLSEAKAVIIVQDREGDFYEQFAEAPEDGKFYLLIRSNHNRLLQQGLKLWNYIDMQPVTGYYKTTIAKQLKDKPRKERTVDIQVKVGKVNLKRPQRKSLDLARNSIELTVIEAREVNSKESDPVLWRLYTTWPVETLEDACQVIEWYRCRWCIEEVFKVLKKECFDIESSELESGWAIRKLTLMILDTVVKLFQMSIAYQTPEDEMPDTKSMFDFKEIECLEKINIQMQGNSQKLSNPFPKKDLAWAFWILARLGGWKGYTSQRKPGFETLIKGLNKFYTIYQGFSMEKDVGTQ